MSCRASLKCWTSLFGWICCEDSPQSLPIVFNADKFDLIMHLTQTFWLTFWSYVEVKIESNILHFLFPSSKVWNKEKKEDEDEDEKHFSCRVSLLFHYVATLRRQHFFHTNCWWNVTSATNGTTWCKQKKKEFKCSTIYHVTVFRILVPRTKDHGSAKWAQLPPTLAAKRFAILTKRKKKKKKTKERAIKS